VPYLSASAVVIHYDETLYQVYAPLGAGRITFGLRIGTEQGRVPDRSLGGGRTEGQKRGEEGEVLAEG